MKQTNTILDKIAEHKKIEIANAKAHRSLDQLKNTLSERKTKIRSFSSAISLMGRPRIIAEIKKASPSAGVLTENFDHVKIAEEYQDSGLVDAISVLTDEKFFQGHLDFIKDVKEVTKVPIFRKDFIFDEYQIYESYLAEADAFLLIVALLELDELKHLLSVSQKLGLDCLVEVHSKEELGLALQAGANVIGVNARDLKTFTMNKSLFEKLSQFFPADVVKVAESGLETREDVEKVVAAGAQAILVGTSLMKTNQKKAKISQLLGIER